jgi:hypothetical protein
MPPVFPEHVSHREGIDFRQAPGGVFRIRPFRHFLALTPLPLSLCNLQTPSATDIKIDIESVEKLIGEIIVQPLR